MVDRIVDARVEDGQLDDAELTLKNLSQIKDAFVQQLLGMYHSRIKYPDNVVPLEQRSAPESARSERRGRQGTQRDRLRGRRLALGEAELVPGHVCHAPRLKPTPS